MDDLQKLLIERECERLVTKYCHLVDHGQAAEVAELFTEDGVWASSEATMSGREQIRFAGRCSEFAELKRTNLLGRVGVTSPRRRSDGAGT